MTPYRSSLAGRIILMSTSVALAGGGAAALVGLPSFAAISAVLLLTIAGGIFGVGLGIEEHPEATAALVIGLPFALFAYALVLQLVLADAPGTGGLLVLLGLVPMVLAFLPAGQRVATRPVVEQVSAHAH